MTETNNSEEYILVDGDYREIISTGLDKLLPKIDTEQKIKMILKRNS